jgi:hypothetical protein
VSSMARWSSRNGGSFTLQINGEREWFRPTRRGYGGLPWLGAKKIRISYGAELRRPCTFKKAWAECARRNERLCWSMNSPRNRENWWRESNTGGER